MPCEYWTKAHHTILVLTWKKDFLFKLILWVGFLGSLLVAEVVSSEGRSLPWTQESFALGGGVPLKEGASISEAGLWDLTQRVLQCPHSQYCSFTLHKCHIPVFSTRQDVTYWKWVPKVPNDTCPNSHPRPLKGYLYTAMFLPHGNQTSKVKEAEYPNWPWQYFCMSSGLLLVGCVYFASVLPVLKCLWSV